MKKRQIIPVILSILMLSGCGSSSESFSASDNGGAMYAAQSYGGSDSSANKGYSYDDYSNESYEYSEAEAAADTSLSDNNEKENNTIGEVIKKEMLVYSCNMTVDVLDFGTAVDSFRNSLNTYGAFVENESYSDGGGTGHWKYSNTEKWQTYYATVRVPSESYDSFCDNAAALGDLRSKTANVQNLNREYYDLSATLEIYETKEERYMELLSTIQDEQYAIAVEEQLTNIQIEISKIKTRMNDIRTDVAYSYVYITINEVKEYTAEPVKTDTFFQRLGNTVSDATKSFLSFMETVLFALIYLFPHIVIIGLVVFAIVKITKSGRKRKAEKKAQAAAGVNIPDSAKSAAEVQPAEPAAETVHGTKTEETAPEASDSKKE